MIFELLLMVYQVSQSTVEISSHYRHVQMNDFWASWYIKSRNLQKKWATIIYMYKWMIFELLLVVYQVSQSIEEMSYHYIHVQMNDLWAATDGISSLSIYRKN